MESVTSFDVLPLDEPEKTQTFVLDNLANDNLHRQITSDFLKAGLSVESIEGLKNYNSWVKYTDKRKQINDRIPQDPAFKLNETYLYHGTSADKDKLCEEGFDVNLASDGCFGRGIYFSDTPSKCLKYAKNNVILLARVILGETKVFAKGKKDSMLLREPEKTEPIKGWRYFDSVKGCPRNLTEYVIYRNENALIEYIVKFRKADDNSQTVSSESQEANVAPELKKEDEPKDPEPRDSDSSDSDNDDGFGDAHGEVYTSSSSDGDESDEESHVDQGDGDDDGDNGGDTSTDESEERPRLVEAWTTQSLIPYFKIKEGNLSLDEKKAEFKRITQEENDTEVDSMMKKTGEDLERAIYLFYAYKQVREDEAKKQAGEPVENVPFEDDGSPIFPPMEPAYESNLWNKLGQEDKKAKMDKMVVDFLAFTLLEEVHRQIATDYVTKAKYNLDTAVLEFYKSWF